MDPRHYNEPVTEYKTKTPVPKKTETTINININVPKVSLPAISRPKLKKPKLPALPYRRIATPKRMAIIAGAALIGLVGFLLVPRLAATQQNRANNVPGNISVSSTPTFTPVAPSAKPELGQGASGKTAYDRNRGSYSYVDTLLGTQITVSEQALPSQFGSAQQAVTKVGSNINAKEPIATSYGTAYMETDAKSGNQVIVASAKDLLILIQSPFRHSSDDWKNYLNNLQ